MSDYVHPYQDVEFVIKELVNFDGLAETGKLEGLNSQFAVEILHEAAKLGEQVLAPLNRVGDSAPATHNEQGVQESPGFAEAYRQYREAGWSSLAAAEQYGGQGLPNVLSTAVNEVIQSANLSFGLCPLLSSGAMEAIQAHGSDALKQTWLPRMVSGEWSGTMNLTEPDAGSDLAAVKSRAVPSGDHYLISGQKIFITWGDHQMTDNIVHLVLARLPDSPVGVRGISLFLVPKFRLDEQGNPAAANDVRCLSIEHKLGIHASPTCTMSFGENGGAVGYLVGEPNQGLACMFTMMNHARQAVGVQGLAVSECSYQHALDYARQRLQGTRQDGSRFSIIQFPDVRRMLMHMKCSTEAMRALAYVAAAEIDRAHLAAGDEQRKHHQARTELLTPIVKGWATELAQEVTYLGLQVHGGMGFIEETGSAQFYRDARILTIYEGTTGIQALDFIGRKVLLNQGDTLQALLAEMAAVADQLQATQGREQQGERLKAAVQAGDEALCWLLDSGAEQRPVANAVSVPLLMLFGYLCGGWMHGLAALSAGQQLQAGSGNEAFLQAKLASADFYSAHLLPRVHSYLMTAKGDQGSTMALDEAQF